VTRRADPTADTERRWNAYGDRYVLDIPDAAIELSVDRLRRKWDELHGELTVRCDLRGARSFEGVLSVAEFNLSSIRARQDRAKHLAERARTPEIDWLGLVEEFVQRVLAAEKRGQPAVRLRDVPRPAPDTAIEIDGLPLLERHPIILFGDGGVAKSYLGLYIAGRLAQQGRRVGFFDWELVDGDQRERYGQMFGEHMPANLWYVRCARPLVHEGDRLRRIVQDEAISYAVYDSVAFACDGPPEAAEVAQRYFQTTRTIPAGSLHIAHVSKAEGADQKPFGSTFWHNGARATWNVKLAESMPGTNQITIGLYNRKANLGGIRPAVGFSITFEADRTLFQRVDVADVADLAGHLSVRQRMANLLRRGALTPETVAEEIGAEVETVKRTARRYPKQFTVIPGGNLGLAERRAS
jgi:hypothetical protein